MKTSGRSATRVLLGAALTVCTTACTTVGTGSGQLADADVAPAPVLFSWKSTDGGIAGTMTASLPGMTFQGRFFQITQQTRSDDLTPLWSNWHRGWYDWPYWSGPLAPPYPSTHFIVHYSGKVVATLEAPGEQRMRCRFHLASPARGMSGGGEGQCQLTDGRVVQAVFPGT